MARPAAGPAGPADGAGGRRLRLVALALLAATWLAFAAPAFAGRARFPVDFAGPPPGQANPELANPELANPELGDAYYAMYPWHDYLGRRLRAGDVPLWDPYRFAGTPFAANSAPGVWYPANWLYATGRVLATFTAITLASLLAALLLAYWFLRGLRLHPLAAALGAVVFAFSAALMRYSANEPVLGSSLWLPLALGGLEVARRGRPGRGAVLAGAGLALSVLAGHAQIALVVWLATALWAVVAVAGPALAGAGRPARRAQRALGALLPAGAAFAVAAGLAAVQLLPTAAFAGEIVRQQTSPEAALRTALPAEHLPTLVLPDYQGTPLAGNYAGPGVNYTETALYAGLATLPLAALGLVRGRRRAAAGFAVLAAVGLAAVLGTPLYRAVLALPGFSRTLFTTRFILLVDAGLAGLAALGLDAVLARPRRRALALAGGSGLLAAAVAALAAARPGTDVAAGFVAGRGLRALALLAGVAALAVALARRPSARAPLGAALVALVSLDLWLFGFPLNPYHRPRPVFPRTGAVPALDAAAGPRPRYANLGGWWVPPNGELAYRLYGISGYDPFVPRRIVELVALADDQRVAARSNFFGPFPPAAAASPVLDLLGVASVATGPATVVPRPGALAPAWRAPCWELAGPAAGLRRLGAMTTAELATTAVVADTAAARAGLGPPPACPTGRPAGRAVVTAYAPERVVVAADGPAAGIVVLSDAWSPGWRATVDGRAAPVLRVDHALRGVAVPAGSHTVELTYRPAPVVAGAAVSAATVAGLGAAAAGGAWRRRRLRRSAGARPRPTTSRPPGG